MKVKFSYWKDGKKKALTMSYDDGARTDLQLVDIFNRYGIKGAFHLNSGLISDYTLSEEEMVSCYVGHEISAHTLRHRFMDCIPREEIFDEVLEDRRRLEKISGYPVCGASYPQGVYNSEVVAVVRMLGYRYCRTCLSTGKFDIPDDFLLWHPTCRHRDEKLFDYLKKFKKTTRPMALFYVWGHSHEFKEDDNWDMIERFCREAGGDDNVWYATNIEIYDYVTALRALRFSVDRTLVYNPTATDVWIEADHVCVKVGAGATLDLETEVKKHESEEK